MNPCCSKKYKEISGTSYHANSLIQNGKNIFSKKNLEE